jgi:hypothetical protein
MQNERFHLQNEIRPVQNELCPLPNASNRDVNEFYSLA